MTFNDKFNFLMRITNTNNTTLAQAVQIDNSAVSLYRSGKRKGPRNREVLERISDYFAKHITLDYQRRALALTSDHMQFNHTMDVASLADMICQWLSGELLSTSQIVQDLINESVAHVNNDSEPDDLDNLKVIPKTTSVLYKNAGKRQAFVSFFNYLLTLDNPQTLYVWVDDDWYSFFGSGDMLHYMQDFTMKLIEYGYSICQITRSPANTTQFYEEFFHWIPAYLTGHVKSYYYPRMRDNLFSKINIVYPGHAAIYSDFLGSISDNAFTVLTAEPGIVSFKENEFLTFLSYCRPSMEMYSSPEDVYGCFSRFSTTKCGHIQKGTSLPPSLMPDDLVHAYLFNAPDSFGKDMHEFYSMHNNTLVGFKNIDICPLATAEQVNSGQVPVVFPILDGKPTLYYTPKTYAEHIRNILDNMERFDNYFFVPIEFDPQDEVSIIVNMEVEAMLIRTAQPRKIFDFSHPEIVHHLQEHLFKIACDVGYNDLARRKIQMQLRELAETLERMS